MRSAAELPGGARVSASASAGTAAIAGIAMPAGAAARRSSLYRQPDGGPRSRAAEIRRRQGDPRHGDERRGDGCRAGRPRGEGNIVDRWRAGVAQHRPAVVDLWQPLDHGLVLWNLDRLTADARIQRIDRRALDERSLSAGARGGGL